MITSKSLPFTTSNHLHRPHIYPTLPSIRPIHRKNRHSSLQPKTSASLYDLITQTDTLVQSQLTSLTPLSFGIVFGSGLLTSLSPCTLSVLPLTIGYIGGFSSADTTTNNNTNKNNTSSLSTPTTTAIDDTNTTETTNINTPTTTNTTSTTSLSTTTTTSSPITRAIAFSSGLATTLAALGLVSSFLGGAYGQIGDGLPIIVSLVAITMGLGLLEVVPLQLPSLDIDTRSISLPPTLSAYLAGLTFALAASPCSTPILATLLAYVSTTKDPVVGSALLFAYALGYVAPLMAAALFTGALQRLLSVRQWTAWVTPASGVMLLAGGTYGLLSRVF